MQIKDPELFTIAVVMNSRHNDAMPIFRGTPLGNPFKMTDEHERDRVCDQYEAYFQEKVAREDPAVLNELSRFTRIAIEQGYIKLGCFCKNSPAGPRCHGDTIARFLESVLNNR